MTSDFTRHNRRSIRLKGYDYSREGAYFIAICSHNRECLFGEIVDGAMWLNDAGKIVANEWRKSAEIRNEIETDEIVVTPNHLHGIVIINNNNHHEPRVGAYGHTPHALVVPIPSGTIFTSPWRITVFLGSPGVVLGQRSRISERGIGCSGDGCCPSGRPRRCCQQVFLGSGG